MNNQTKHNQTEGSIVSEPAPQIVSHEMLICHNYWCNYKTNEPLSKCPKCGRPLLTPRTFRLLGWIQMSLGAFLAIVGTLLLILVAYNSGKLRGVGAKLLVYGILGLVTAVGLTFMTAGLRQALSGSRSQSLIAFALMLLVTITIIAAIARAFL